MNTLNAGGMRELAGHESAIVSGGVKAEPTVYYEMGKKIGEAYAWVRSETADFYEWVASL